MPIPVHHVITINIELLSDKLSDKWSCSCGAGGVADPEHVGFAAADHILFERGDTFTWTFNHVPEESDV